MDAHHPDTLIPQQHGERSDVGHRPPTLSPRRDTHDNGQLARQIDELDQLMRHEDPSLWKRFRRLNQTWTRIEVAVFALIVLTAVLFATALAVSSVVAWFAGLGAFLAASFVDNRHRRALRPPPPTNARRVLWR
jgi:hypothetical protein